MRSAARAPTAEALTEEAIQWLAVALGEAAARHGAADHDLPPRGPFRRLNDRIEARKGRRPLPELKPHGASSAGSEIDLVGARRVAREGLLDALPVPAGDEPDEWAVAAAYCRTWSTPEAGALARAWLMGDATYLEEQRMETRTIAVIVGVAAAAAVLGLVILTRRRGWATVQGRREEASHDFTIVRRMSERDDPAGIVASKMVASTIEPWTFSLPTALAPLPKTERRILLAALADDSGTSVQLLCPAAGDSFDPASMTPDAAVDLESVWVVALSPARDAVGYRRGAEVLVRAEVTVCTVDWWLLAVAHPECPVGKAVFADPEKYTGLDTEYVRGWTATLGLRSLADLRREFDEPTLRAWSDRLVSETAESYPSQIARQVHHHGAIGDAYDPSAMKCAAGSPVAATRVVEIVERGGVPQRGLGCSRAPPLLYAIVRVEEA